MATVIIVIHLMVVVTMIGLVLLQRSEGGALGIGGGGGAFMTGRGAANILTRSTGILAAVFFLTSVSLALLSRMESSPSDIFNALPGVITGAPAPASTPATPPVSGGGSAEDMLKQLGGSSDAPGPQAPPAPASDNGAATDSGAAMDAAPGSSSDASGSGGSMAPAPASELAAPMDGTMGAPAADGSAAPAADAMAPASGDGTAPADGSAPQAPPAN